MVPINAIERARRFGQPSPHVHVRLSGPALLQLMADAQLHVAGGGMCERHRDDLVDGGPARDDLHDAVDERGGLPGPRGRLDDPTPVESRAHERTLAVLTATPAIPSTLSAPAATSR